MENQKSYLHAALAVISLIVIVLAMKSCLGTTVSVKDTEAIEQKKAEIKAEIEANIQKIKTDTGKYSVDTQPVGLGKITLELGETNSWQPEEYARFKTQVYKNSGTPSNSIIYVDFAILDENNKQIGMTRANTSNLKNNETGLVGSGFEIDENYVPVYEGVKVHKISVLHIHEEDNMPGILKSELDSKIQMLQGYVDKKDEQGFLSLYEKVIALYPADKFPEENAKLIEFKKTALQTLGKKEQTTTSNTQKPQTEPTKQNNSSSGGGQKTDSSQGIVTLNGFTIISHDPSNGTVVGVIRNDTGRYIEDAYIEIAFYDSEGIKMVETATAFVEDLQPNAKARFVFDSYDIPGNADVYEIVDMGEF